MSKEIINKYIKDVYEMFLGGCAREESYYSLLEQFLMKLSFRINFKDLKIITMPKKTDAGNPDFVIKGLRSNLVGYIEAKEPLKNLDEMEITPQLKRYREVFPNLILTNFLEFRVYREGLRIHSISLIKGNSIIHGGLSLDALDTKLFLKILKYYFSYRYPDNLKTRDLARELAKRTRFMRDYVVIEELQRGDISQLNEEENHIMGFFNAFKKYLIHDLKENEFADLYSQTLTFGLFTAAVQCQAKDRKLMPDMIPLIPDVRINKFKRERALMFIPHSNGILHNLFEFISIGNVPQQLQSIMDDIVHVMNSVDIHVLLNEYFQEQRGEDPIHHFYETFLGEYDPQVREKRGVYYTPRSVVSFIVRSIHVILQKQLNRVDGLADRRLRVLDPAAGTSTFLAEAANLAIHHSVEKYGEGIRNEFARNYLTNNLYGFEIMMAPYAVAYLKMAYMLEIAKGKLKENQRLNIYLTNALEMDEIEQSNLPGMSTLSRESQRAGEIKKNTLLHVIMGNPPYAGHSLTKSDTVVSILSKQKRIIRKKIKTWIGEQIESYKKINGIPLQERNLKWLQDDYVKFIRFAQVKIEETGEGVIGMVTNHAYLDNPTFRGMRFSLLNTFNEIYILNLHGNAMKKEKAPGKQKDENVFDIRQGVAISLFIKKKNDTQECRVFYSDLWGIREDKYEFLGENEINTIKWTCFSPVPPFYLFIPGFIQKNKSDQGLRYNEFYKITEIFPINSVGIVTARDNLTIKRSADEMASTLRDFSGMDEGNARLSYHLGNDSRDWRVKEAQKDILENGVDINKIVPILYRPFDTRYTYYTGKSRGFICMPRSQVMRNMLLKNIGLVTVRQVAEGEFNHCFISETIIESRVTTSNKGIAYFFPLYVYLFPQKNQKGLFNQMDPNEFLPRKPNINGKIIELLKGIKGGGSIKPEQILFYIYAILFSTVYRNKYIDHLKIDFPRIPFVLDYDLFIEMARLGKKLAEVHLLSSNELEHTFSKFEVDGDNGIKCIHFQSQNGENGRVYINDKQYFSNISKDIWNYNICGYRILEKWLKLRPNHKNGEFYKLTLEEMAHFIKIAQAVQLTGFYQKSIDRLYPFVEKNLKI